MRRAVVLVIASCASPTSADVVDVTRGDLVIAAAATGELAAVDTTGVAPPSLPDVWTFKITWLAPEGSTVAAGERVVAFDTGELDRALAVASIEVDASRKRLAKRRKEALLARGGAELAVLGADVAARKAALERQTPAELVASLDVRERALDDELARMAVVETTRAAAQSRQEDDADVRATAELLASAQARSAQLADEISRMTAASPRAGVVVYLRKVGASVYRSDAAVQIVGLDSMMGRGAVDEVDLPRVAVHQRVTLRLDAMPDLMVHGTITAIGRSVQARSADDPSKVVAIEIAVEPVAAALRPGMRFHARVETERVAGVVMIPSDAVFVTADGPIAIRATGERVPLVLGRRSSEAIEVVSGLAPGDRVSRVVEAP